MRRPRKRVQEAYPLLVTAFFRLPLTAVKLDLDTSIMASCDVILIGHRAVWSRGCMMQLVRTFFKCSVELNETWRVMVLTSHILGTWR